MQVSLNSKCTQWFMLAIVVVCGGMVRLVFILATPQAPVMYDAEWYHAVALDMMAARDHLIGGDFQSVHLGLGKAPVYSAFLAIVYTLFGVGFAAVRTTQAMLDSLTCVLLYFVARHFGGPRASMLVALLACMCPPLIIATGLLLPESLTVFALVLVTFLLLEGLSRPRVGIFAFAGILTALLIYIRGQSVQFLFFAIAVVLSAVFLNQRAFTPKWWSFPLVYVGSACLIVGLWLVGTRVAYGQAVLGPKFDYDFASDLYHRAQAPGSFWWAYDSSLVQRTLEKSLADNPTGIPNYPQAIVDGWLNQPILFVQATFGKLYRYWHHPYNDYAQAFPWSLRHQRYFQQVLLVLSLFGLGIIFRHRHAALVFYTTPVYIVALCLFVWVEPRYLVPAIPYAIVLAGLAVATLLRGAKETISKLRWMDHRAGTLVPFVFLASAGMALVLSSTILLLDPDDRHLLVLIVGLLCWLGVGFVVATVTRPVLGTRLSTFNAAIAVVFICTVSVALYLTDSSWRQWILPLDNPDVRLRQLLTLEPDLDLASYRSATLEIDTWQRPGHACRLIVEVDGKQLPGHLRTSGLDEIARTYLAARRTSPDLVRGWYSVPIDLDVLRNKKSLVADIRLAAPPDGYNCGVSEIYGDYETDAAQAFVGPSFSDGDMRIYKWLVDNDFRLWTRAPLANTSARSWFFDKKTWREDDLSTVPGKQTGQYRVRLLLWHEDGSFVVY